jgi:hypothetical protein
MRADASRAYNSIVDSSATDATMAITVIPTDSIRTFDDSEWIYNNAVYLQTPFRDAKGLVKCKCHRGADMRGGWHSQDCCRSGASLAAHQELQYYVHNTIQKTTQMTSSLEPVIHREINQMRTDLLIYSGGDRITIDFSTINTTAPSNAKNGAGHKSSDRYGNQVDYRSRPLRHAEVREKEKDHKYKKICADNGITFHPYVKQNTGGSGASTKFLDAIMKKQWRLLPNINADARLRTWKQHLACLHRKAFIRTTRKHLAHLHGQTASLVLMPEDVGFEDDRGDTTY